MLSVPLAVPVCSTMAPPLTEEAGPVLPLAASIAARRLATVPPVEIWLAPAVPVTKVSVVPSTVMPPMPDVKNALFVATDAYGMGQTGGAILVAGLEKVFKKPAAEISGDVVTAVEVPGLSVLENRMAGQVDYRKKGCRRSTSCRSSI